MESSLCPLNLEVREPLAADAADFSMDVPGAFEALARAEDQHFWHRSRNRIIAERLSNLGFPPRRGGLRTRVLELGCGGGCVARHLDSLGYDVTAVEGHLSLATRAAERVPGARVIAHDLGRGLTDVGRAFDVVALFDVIEHLDDPVGALRSALALASQDGIVVGTVPALDLLWSKVDELAGHKRRYDSHSLRGELERVGHAKTLEVVPFHRLIVPLMLLQRRALDRAEQNLSSKNLSVPPAPLNLALLAALRLEAKLDLALGGVGIPGSSLWFSLTHRKA